MRLGEYYTVGELLQLHEEKAQKNEFNPKFGNGAKRSSNDNEKAVNDTIKNAESLNKGISKQEPARKEKVKFEDYNKTTMDVNFEYPADEKWKTRVRAQVLGYPSEENMKHNDYDPALGFEGNKKFYDDRSAMSKDRAERNEKERIKGIVGRNNDDHDVKKYNEKTAFNESRPSKRLIFKNTIFLNEEQVLRRVPEDYKVDENKFYMRDKTGTDYLVECQADPFGYVHMQITNRINKQSINEELDKIKRLSSYSYGDDNVKVDKTQLEDMSESISNFRRLLK